MVLTRILPSELAGPWQTSPYLILRKMVVLDDKDPETPITVTGYILDLALRLALNVNALLPVVGLGPKAAVTPFGSPETKSVTLELNPF